MSNTNQSETPVTTKGRLIQIKSGLSADFSDDVLKVAEFGLILDKNELRIGLADGTTMKVNGGGGIENIPDASLTQKGLMTQAHVVKLNGISSGANFVQIEDNLTSTSATSALSAKQGKLLNDKLTSHINDVMLHNGEFNQYITNPDDKDIYRTVTFKRTDGTNYMISNLSNPDINGNYQTLVWDFYGANGTTKTLTKTWTMTYDSKGNITSKVVS